MANDNETVREVCAEMRGMGNYQSFSGDHARELANRIESAHEREMAEKAAEIARLKEALKPVMECDIRVDSDIAIANAVREAQRVMREGGAE